ncbi:MAG: 50S ribosomal protein L28 [Flavobacteriales bacterium]|nr:50S ribosomal protein L28 [Flavobacteriales bacterium]
MARVCQLTGKKMMVGNNVSHSKRRTKRRFYPNLIDKKFYIPEDNKWVSLRISTSALKTINKIGIKAAIERAKEKGYYKG